MAHRGAQRALLAIVVAAVEMVEHAGARPALPRDCQVGLDRIELHLVGYLPEELSFQPGKLGLDRPHELHAFGNEIAQGPKAVAQPCPSFRALQQFLEPILRPGGKDDPDSRVPARIGEGVECDIDAAVTRLLYLAEHLAGGGPGAASDEDQMRYLERHARPPRALH